MAYSTKGDCGTFTTHIWEQLGLEIIGTMNEIITKNVDAQGSG